MFEAATLAPPTAKAPNARAILQSDFETLRKEFDRHDRLVNHGPPGHVDRAKHIAARDSVARSLEIVEARLDELNRKAEK